MGATQADFSLGMGPEIARSALRRRLAGDSRHRPKNKSHRHEGQRERIPYSESQTACGLVFWAGGNDPSDPPYAVLVPEEDRMQSTTQTSNLVCQCLFISMTIQIGPGNPPPFRIEIKILWDIPINERNENQLKRVICTNRERQWRKMAERTSHMPRRDSRWNGLKFLR
jgi:hypothetical protein